MYVELGRQPAYGSETGARGAGRGITVPEATLDVVHAGATIDGQQFDHSGVVIAQRLHQQFSAPCVEQKVVSQFCGRDRHLAGDLGGEFKAGDRLRGAARFADLARIVDDKALLSAPKAGCHS